MGNCWADETEEQQSWRTNKESQVRQLMRTKRVSSDMLRNKFANDETKCSITEVRIPNNKKWSWMLRQQSPKWYDNYAHQKTSEWILDHPHSSLSAWEDIYAVDEKTGVVLVDTTIKGDYDVLDGMNIVLKCMRMKRQDVRVCFVTKVDVLEACEVDHYGYESDASLQLDSEDETELFHVRADSTAI